MGEYRIVPMREAHLDDIVRMDALCFTRPWTRNGFRAELESAASVFLVAEEDGAVVGCAGMQCVCGECYIEKVCVHPQRRRKGVAAALMRDLIRSAAARNAKFLTLEVRVTNVLAIALYEHFGFRRVGIRKNFYTDLHEDAALMTRYFPAAEGRESPLPENG